MKATCFAVFRLTLCSIAFIATLAHANCVDDSYKQFDFWLGKWKVIAADGKLAGYNHIKKSLNNCVIFEHYQTESGFEGNSLNSFDLQAGQWHQTWMDNSGFVLKIDGGLQGDAMIMTGAGKNPQGQAVQHKITWTPNSDGSVRQHWQTKRLESDAWSTAFDGLYHKIQ